ncbi:hypothetical protein FSARC_2040 [Fusarium sarcochroum]|uniref:Phosphatidic acid phosphatase type 2/haloperoxidase domain-containing protein n=1 Tax=Fusarium sarcochroum TaxID=1208366 RepID=A0A8H4XDF8_9HYPO|nr:hypothetical protein FSARC_2040 [Fusarium sarcochroum]
MPLLPRINPAVAATPESKTEKLKEFLKQWFLVNYHDLLCMAVVGGLAFGIYHSPVIITRTFPITFDATSGDIVYPQWAYPDRGWILPSWLSGLISIAIPIIVYIAAQIRIKSAWDASNAIIGTTWSVIMASLFQVTLKQLVGGFRPYFLDVCMPDISLAKSHNKTGLNGVGFYQIMYTTEICTQPDASRIQNAITSFPSGHTTAAFAGFGFLFLWLNAKLKVWADHKPAFWKLCLTFMPLLAAVLIAGSLTIDAAHNWYDILGGGFIGTIMAYASYRSTYAAIWDWRFNHLPLRETETFRYGFDGDLDYAAQTLAMTAGWGGKKVRLPESESTSGPAISTESTLRSGAEGIENLDANTRRKRRGPVGDEAVFLDAARTASDPSIVLESLVTNSSVLIRRRALHTRLLVQRHTPSTPPRLNRRSQHALRIEQTTISYLVPEVYRIPVEVILSVAVERVELSATASRKGQQRRVMNTGKRGWDVTEDRERLFVFACVCVGADRDDRGDDVGVEVEQCAFDTAHGLLVWLG